jgi:hypothetical protein
MKTPMLTGTEIVQGAPPMTFEEARVAVLQAASQLQGLLTIYPALETAAIAEKAIKTLTVQKQKLEKDLGEQQKAHTKKLFDLTTQQQRDEAAFQERIDGYKTQIQLLIDEVKATEATTEQAKAKVEEEFLTFQQEIDAQILVKKGELADLSSQVLEAQTKLNKVNAALIALKDKL